MEKVARFMEFFWLALAILTALGAVYILATQGWAEGSTWLLFPAVCLAMWGYRRFLRKRVAQWAEREGQEQEHRS